MINGYKFDITTNPATLTINKTFEKLASIFNSEAYRIIKQLRADYPDMAIVRTEGNKKTTRRSITFAQMEQYISIFDENGMLQEQFEKVKVMSKIQASPYKYVKTWFENQFPNYTKQVAFDENGKMSFVEESKTAEGVTPEKAIKVA